jgi:ABC-type amino acid transport system permease subunit
MLETHQTDAGPGVASLVGGILEDAQRLVRQEVALAQREIAQSWEKAKMGIVLLAAALAVCGVVGVLLGFMLVKLLQQYLLPSHEWVCFAIVGGVTALLACVLVYCGIRQIGKIHLSLPQTAETLPEDAHAANGAVPGGRLLAEATRKQLP